MTTATHKKVTRKKRGTYSATKEAVELLTKKFPEHQILTVQQLSPMIQALRYANGGNSWTYVARQLTASKIIHNRWRSHGPAWTEQLVCCYAHRWKIADKRIWRQRDYKQRRLELETYDPETELEPVKEKTAISTTEPPASSTKISFESEGMGFKIRGHLMCHQAEAPRISFHYEGVPDQHFLRFLQERGLTSPTV